MGNSADSGRYVYRCNGSVVPVAESFSRRRDGDAIIIESSREAPGILLEVEASGRHSLVEHCVITCRREAQPTLRAELSLSDDQLIFSRWVDGELSDQFSSARETAPLLSPLMRIFYGPVILDLAGRNNIAGTESAGEGEVAMPAIADPTDAERFLQLQVSRRRARRLDGADDVAAGPPASVCFEYTGDQYGPGTRFWIDPQGDLVAYRWQQPGSAGEQPAQWEVELVRG